MTTASYDRPLRLRLFGLPELLEDRGVDGWHRVLSPGKPLILLARLCLDPDGMSRDQLAAFLWPDMPEDRARASSRQALHVLRQILGPDRLESDRRRVKLQTPIATDVADFLAAIANEDDARAVSLYRGAFLAEQILTDANEAEQWLTFERARFRNLFSRSASRRVPQLQAAGATTEAADLLRRLRTEEPTEIGHWQRLLALLDESGAQAALHTEIDALRALLDAGTLEPLDAPRSWRQLIAEYEKDGAPRVAERAIPVPTSSGWRGRFVGRRAELRLLADRWEAIASQQQGRRLVIAGHAGIGKSRLLAEFVSGPRTEGATVVWVRGRRAGRGDRFGLLTDLIAALTECPGSLGIMEQSAAALVGLVPSLAQTFPGASWHERLQDDRQVGAAVRDLLSTLAEERSIVVILDDLHWADEPSIAILDDVTSSLQGIPAFIIAASRPRHIPMTAAWERMDLGPLAGEQIASLVAELEGARLAPAVIEALTRITGGVPLQAVQALRLLATRGSVRKEAGVWHMADDHSGLPNLSGRDLVAVTIAECSADARRTLGYLALADAVLTREELAANLGHSRAVEAVIRELEEADLVVATEPDAWRVAHDVVADAVLHALPVEQRRTISLELASRATQGMRERAVPITELRRIVRLFLDAEAPDAMLDAVDQWVRQTPNAPRGAALADLVLGTGASPIVRQQIRRAIPDRKRSMATTAATAAAAVAITLLIAMWWLRQPARLELVNTPILTARAGVPPIFEVRDRLGRVTNALDGDTLHAAILLGDHIEGGQHQALIMNGLVALNDLWVYESPEEVARNPVVQVRATTRRIPPTLITVKALDRDSLWLESGMINGQTMTTLQPTVRVVRGDSITGWIRARFNSPHAGILIMMSHFSNWMPPIADTVSVASLITPAKRAFQYIPDIRYRAPLQPGTYWLTWTFTSEPAAVWIASSTSWRCQTPVWTDGNEKGESPAAALQSLWGHGGRLAIRRRICEPGKPVMYEESSVPAMSIRVIVE